MTTKSAKLGVLILIAVTVSACGNRKTPVQPEPISKVRTEIQVCSVPLSFRTLKDSPSKPRPTDGRKYPTNSQMDIYWKTQVNVGQVCELACALRDVLFICTEGQDQLVNPPRQCLDEEGNLRCN